jgi:hypothetical protein
MTSERGFENETDRQAYMESEAHKRGKRLSELYAAPYGQFKGHKVIYFRPDGFHSGHTQRLFIW